MAGDMTRKRGPGAAKTVAERVKVPKKTHTTNWYANVDGELRFSTTKGHGGISEWKNFDWHMHVKDCHLFTWKQFRQWVVEHVEAEEREATGTCDTRSPSMATKQTPISTTPFLARKLRTN
jgi:hypothetical protein